MHTEKKTLNTTHINALNKNALIMIPQMTISNN